MMLADSIEATVKSLTKPTPKRIEDVVNDTIRKKLEDGQFDECDLTMRDIHVVGEAIREALIGFLGPRIEYPGAPAEGRNGQSGPRRRTRQRTGPPRETPRDLHLRRGSGRAVRRRARTPLL